ncbi:MAG TPA: CHAT domain-containing protein [Pyrinomonadaceae bacterium]|nr:CHAT domain-containing protein [Pyrinomonadaceae bacterium]
MKLTRLTSTLLICGLLLLCQSTASLVRALEAPLNPLTTVQEQATELPALTPGERELKGGETHSFRISLPSGQFFHALVEQKNIDVIVRLFGPDGEKLSVTNGPNPWDAEPVLIVAAKTGDYRVEISSEDSKAKPGRYKIQIIADRVATPADKGHVAAQRLFEEAEDVRQQPQATGKRQAIEKHQQALPLFEAAGDTYRQALTARQIGFAYFQLNEFRTGLGFINQALSLAQSIGERRLEASLRTFLGGAYDVFGDPRQALDHYFLALSLARETGIQSTEGSALNNIGKIYNDMADRQRALDYYQQALPIFRTLGSRLEGITLNNIGVTYSMLGEPQKGLGYLQQALPLLQKLGDKNAVSYTLSNIGGVYSRSGDYLKALDYYNEAQAIQKETGNRGQQAETLDLVGEAYLAQGQPDKALEYHQQAVEILHATGNLRRKAISLNNLGRVYNALGQPEKALDQFTQALTISRGIEDLNTVAIALEGTARAETHRGNLDHARKSLEESLSLIETVRTRSTSPQLRAAYLATMKRAYEFYVDLLMQQHAKDPSRGHDAEALRASERSRARSLTEMLNEAHLDIRQGVDAALIEKERSLAQLLNAKAQRHIQLLAQKGSKDEIAIVKREISALEDDYQQVLAAIRKNSPQYAALTQPEPLGLKEIQSLLDPNTLLLEYSLGDERSYVWAVGSNSLKSYELPKRELIEKTARQVHKLLTARSESKAGETAGEKQDRLRSADLQLGVAAQELSKILLEPIAADLGSKRLVVIADGALQYVPFAALPVVNGQLSANKYRPLILDHEIITLPSASALAVQRTNLADRKLAPKEVAVLADPVFSLADDRLHSDTRGTSKQDAQTDAAEDTRILEHIADASTGKLTIRRLRFTRQEADQILAVAPRKTNLKALDFKASRTTAKSSDLSQYRYVHFATHGYLDSERADLSAVVLSMVDEQGKPQDGFLRAHEIYNLNLPAELVVLSACQTGLGKEIKGEGLVGLTRGFMYAGARRVVVSLWNVNDKATAELMQRFYRGMLKEKLSPAASLRRAQAEMSRHPQWQSPYYWAAFVLQGEWR